jgi:cation transport regulator ChaC
MSRFGRPRGGEHVFGYGSLLQHSTRARGLGARRRAVACELANYRRTWNVAMDNTRTIPGYKYYVDAVTGARPPWFVTFLNIVPDPGGTVNGVVFEVTRELLSQFDERERNYARIDVTSDVSLPMDGRVWAYTGRDTATGRFELGLQTGRAVISRRYHDEVLADFETVDIRARQRFVELTDPPPCPIVDLQRIEVPDERPTQRR